MKRVLGYLQIGEDSDALFAHGQSATSCKFISRWHQGISTQAHPSVLCCHIDMM